MPNCILYQLYIAPLVAVYFAVRRITQKRQVCFRTVQRNAPQNMQRRAQPLVLIH